ncbi:MAG TPA: FtsW/RodA/SpoVE family cell cycle protein, partial [Acidobacteriota bacterium]|nr:FtsW/RodA/SpoVE family cell cycle protein [Acidobacteriota bacterium]
LVTLNPERDPQGVGYQTRQAKIAIGSGGFWGKGIGKGTQSQLGFVPESHTDFVFAVLAEETGFLGGVTILALYLWLILGVA